MKNIMIRKVTILIILVTCICLKLSAHTNQMLEKNVQGNYKFKTNTYYTIRVAGGSTVTGCLSPSFVQVGSKTFVSIVFTKDDDASREYPYLVNFDSIAEIRENDSATNTYCSG